MEDNKLNLVLSELKNICNTIEEKFAQVDENFERIDKHFEQIDSRFDKLESRFDNLEKRFDKFEEKNEAEHTTMFNMLNSLTSK